MTNITIHTDFIKLDQLLKFAGAAMTGSEAKEMILAGRVTVDGEICTQRGRKIQPGMCVAVDGGHTAAYTVGREG